MRNWVVDAADMSNWENDRWLVYWVFGVILTPLATFIGYMFATQGSETVQKYQTLISAMVALDV